MSLNGSDKIQMLKDGLQLVSKRRNSDTSCSNILQLLSIIVHGLLTSFLVVWNGLYQTDLKSSVSLMIDLY